MYFNTLYLKACRYVCLSQRAVFIPNLLEKLNEWGLHGDLKTKRLQKNTNPTYIYPTQPIYYYQNLTYRVDLPF